jgi:hypothetical protein
MKPLEGWMKTVSTEKMIERARESESGSGE